MGSIQAAGYNDANRAAILNSRIVPTSLLGNVISQLADPPALWINITSATIYRHAEDRAQDEETGEIGYGFSIDICRKWEAAFYACNTPKTRKVALRMGIVLGKKDGVFPRLLNLVRLVMGGRQGTGRQYISWVHEYDAARCTQWLLDHRELEGVFNCTAPEAVRNEVFMRIMRSSYGISVGLPTPQWLLEVGALVIGTEPELILKSRWVTPAKLLDSGFRFSFEKASAAINDVLSTSV